MGNGGSEWRCCFNAVTWLLVIKKVGKTLFCRNSLILISIVLPLKNSFNHYSLLCTFPHCIQPITNQPTNKIDTHSPRVNVCVCVHKSTHTHTPLVCQIRFLLQRFKPLELEKGTQKIVR